MAVRSNTFLALCLIAFVAVSQAYHDKKPKPAPKPTPAPLPTPTPTPTPSQCLTAYQVIAAEPRLLALKNAIDNAGLYSTLSNPDFVGTIFAPVNDAVAICFRVGCLTRDTILYHAIPGLSYKALQLIATGNPSSYLMANGGLTTVRFINAQARFTISSTLNTATVIQGNIPFCKGFVHIIDTVLNPAASAPVPVPVPGPGPTPAPACTSAYQAIAALPQFSNYVQALLRTGRAAVLNDTNFAGTIFAPLIVNAPLPGVNEAFAVDTLIVPGSAVAFPVPLAGSTLTSRQGRQLTIAFDNNAAGPQNLRVTVNNGALATFLNPGTVNVRGCSGRYVIHAVGSMIYS